MRVSTRLRISATFVAVAVAAVGCTGHTSRHSSGDVSDSAAPRRGGTLIVLSNQDVDSIDPGISFDLPSWTYLALVTQRTLFAYNPTNPDTLEPDLAAGPATISPDGKQITVKLKPDVDFSPPVNRAVTSDDTEYAALAGWQDFAAGKTQHIAGIVTPDPSTLEFRLTSPTAGAFLGALTMPLAAPVPADYAKPFDAQSISTYGMHQVATGPYMIQNDSSGQVTGYQPNRQLILVRNPNWKASTDFRPAYLDRIVEKFGNTDATVASRQVLGGTAMVSGNITPAVGVLQSALGGSQKSQVKLLPSSPPSTSTRSIRPAGECGPA